MVKRTVTVTVTPGTGTITAYWVAIDKKDVRLVSGVGTTQLDAGRHMFILYYEGNQLSTISATVVDDQHRQLLSKAGSIPAGQRQWAEFGPFDL